MGQREHNPRRKVKEPAKAEGRGNKSRAARGINASSEYSTSDHFESTKARTPEKAIRKEKGV